MEPQKKILSRSDYMHFQIAVRYFFNFKEVRDSFIKSEKWNELKGIDWENISENDPNVKKLEDIANMVLLQTFEMRTYIIITLTNAVMCLEGLINLYGSMKSSNTYFKNHLEKLDTVSKWIVIPKLFTGNEIDKGTIVFENFKLLIKSRNNMIHPKSSYMEPGSDSSLPDLHNLIKEIKQLDKQFQSMLKMINELNKLDPTFKPIEIYKFIWDANLKMPDFSDYKSFKDSLFIES